MLLAQTSKWCNTRKQPQQQEKRGFHLTSLLLEQDMPSRDNIVLPMEQETLSKALNGWVPAQRKLVAALLWISKRTGFYKLRNRVKSFSKEGMIFFQDMPNDKHRQKQAVMMWKHPESDVGRAADSASASSSGAKMLSLFLSHWVFLPQKTESSHAHRVEQSRLNNHHFVTAGSYQTLYNPGSSENGKLGSCILPWSSAITCPVL